MARAKQSMDGNTAAAHVAYAYTCLLYTSSIIALVFKKCASGSVGRAQPCQGWGRGFESRLALSY